MRRAGAFDDGCVDHAAGQGGGAAALSQPLFVGGDNGSGLIDLVTGRCVYLIDYRDLAGVQTADPFEATPAHLQCPFSQAGLIGDAGENRGQRLHPGGPRRVQHLAARPFAFLPVRRSAGANVGDVVFEPDGQRHHPFRRPGDHGGVEHAGGAFDDGRQLDVNAMFLPYLVQQSRGVDNLRGLLYLGQHEGVHPVRCRQGYFHQPGRELVDAHHFFGAVEVNAAQGIARQDLGGIFFHPAARRPPDRG